MFLNLGSSNQCQRLNIGSQTNVTEIYKPRMLRKPTLQNVYLFLDKHLLLFNVKGI